MNSTTGATNEPSGALGNNNGTDTVTRRCTPPDRHGEHGQLHADAGVVGSPITCTAICENVGTVTATAASCSINTSGLPGRRWRVARRARMSPGGTLACTVSFTPTVTGSITVPATTSASNELTSNNDSKPRCR